MPKKKPKKTQQKSNLLVCLEYLFLLVLGLRFYFPIHYSPANAMYSDMSAHWGCALEFMHPDRFCASVPKIFLLWLKLEQILISVLPAGAQPVIMGLFAAMLCAAMPWVWYRAIREVMPKTPALATAIVIGICPSLLAIYYYTLNETIWLVLTGFSFWMTLRAVRKKTLRAYSVAVLSWAIAVLAKQSALLYAVFSIAYMVYFQPRKPAALASTLLIIAITFVPAGLHTAIGLKVFLPTRTGTSPKLYRLTNTQWIQYQVSDGKFYNFSSPAFHSNPFEPFGSYQTWRLPGMEVIHLDADKVKTGLDEAIKKYSKKRTLLQDLLDTRETIIYFLFAPSWPDYDQQHWFGLLDFHSRWMWAPLILGLLFAVPFVEVREKEAFFLICLWVMILVIMFQQNTLMDGRYRKAVEPLVLICAAILLQQRIKPLRAEKKRLEAVEDFVDRVFIGQCIQYIVFMVQWASLRLRKN